MAINALNMKIFKNVIILVAILVLTKTLSYSVGDWFAGFFGESRGSWIDGTALLGLIPTFLFFSMFLFTAFGDRYKYYWIGVLMLPVLWFVIKLDLAHWYFYLALALIGWGIGWVVNRMIKPKVIQ